MTNYEGEMVTKEDSTMLPMETASDPNEIFELAAVQTSTYEDAVDTAISCCYIPDDKNTSRYDTDALFGSNINDKLLESKFKGAIGSTTTSPEECCLFLNHKPLTLTTEELEESLSSVLDEPEITAIVQAVAASKSQGATSDQLSKLWMINDELAQGAVDQNTQLARHSSDNILSKQISTNDRMLRYKRIQSVFYSDTMFAKPKAKSLRGNKCCQVFVSDKGFVAVYPMKTQSEFQDALHWFCKQVGVPIILVVDGHKAQTSNKTKQFCLQVGTTLRVLERGTPWANRAELYIGLLKEAVCKDM